MGPTGVLVGQRKQSPVAAGAAMVPILFAIHPFVRDIERPLGAGA